MVMLDRVVPIEGDIYIIEGRVVEVDPKSFDINKPKDVDTIASHNNKIWTDENDTFHMRPHGGKTYHRYARLQGGDIHVVPGHMGRLSKTALKKISDTLQAMKGATEHAGT